MKPVGNYSAHHKKMGVTLPRPDKTGHLEWLLRYSPESITREHQLAMAAVMAAYRELIMGSQSAALPKMAALKRLAKAMEPSE